MRIIDAVISVIMVLMIFTRYYSLAIKTRIFVFTFFVLAFPVFAEIQWDWIGPPNGFVTKILPHPKNPYVWFAINQESLYRSTDSGATWQTTNLHNIDDVEVHPITSEVFALDQNGHGLNTIWLSTDGGRLFKPISQIKIAAGRLYLHPQNEKVIYIIGYESYVSLNKGKTWTEVGTEPLRTDGPYRKIDGSQCYINNFQFVDFLIFPNDPHKLFASAGPTFDCFHGPSYVFDPFLLLSNLDHPWKIILRGFANEPYQFKFDFRDPNRAFILSPERGLDLLTPSRSAPLSNVVLSDVAIVPDNSFQLYAVRKRDPYHNLNSPQLIWSKNGGHSWEIIPDNIKDTIEQIKFFQKPQPGLFASTVYAGGGLYRKSLNASNWQDANAGFQESSNRIVEGYGSNVYAAGNFFYRSTDSGVTWKNLSFNLPFGLAEPQRPQQFISDPWNPSRVFFTRDHLYRSTNGGKTWEIVSQQPYAVVAFDPHKRNVVYLVKNQDAFLYKSSSGGTNPERLPTKTDYPVTSLWIDPFNPQIFFIITEGGLYKSADGGISIERLPRKDPLLRIASLGKPNQYLLKSWRFLYKTMDGARTFRKIATVTGHLLPADFVGKRFLIYSGHRLYISENSGSTWKLLKLPYANRPGQINSVTIYDITDPRYHPLYIATETGLYKASL